MEWSPLLSGVLTSSYTRGAVSGLGVINVWAALAELAEIFGRRGPEAGGDPPGPADDPQSATFTPGP